MFQIKSFLKYPQRNITDLDDVVKLPEKYFVEMTDLVALNGIYNQLDFMYLDGAIIIKYCDKELVGFRLWDLVAHLWAYIVNVIRDFMRIGEGSTYFPDQPVELRLQKVSEHLLLFSVTGSEIVKIVLPRDDFLLALLDGAEQFFACMSDTFNAKCNYSNELKEIMELKAAIG
ncbi:hypothetical protein K0T92_19630 [Paenibacillus oenotherae]|uniref:Uncharacterized protein n=1 Tax=Paenibacillus oenotherae TaxID=1435645 RepID=A0ABS7DAG9_9BACL|nr:hypothetical protein [Paenibacillus oenotherae]MBW7476932.1 hypothetical protein [Paenibacillus oenotherae]